MQLFELPKQNLFIFTDLHVLDTEVVSLWYDLGKVAQEGHLKNKIRVVYENTLNRGLCNVKEYRRYNSVI